MADLGTLLVTGASVNGTTNWTGTTTYTNIDEAIASADGAVINDGDANVSHAGDYFASYLLGDTPSNLDSMTTISVNVRYRVKGAQTNYRTLYCQLVRESDGIALVTNRLIEGGITSTTLKNSGALAFTIVGTPTKAQWDDARLVFRLDIVKNKGGDTNGLEIDSVEVTGTYVAGVTTHQATAAASLTVTPAASASISVYSATAAGSVTVTPAASAMLIAEATAAGAVTITPAATALAELGVSAAAALTITPAANAELAVVTHQATASAALTITPAATTLLIAEATAAASVTLTPAASTLLITEATAAAVVTVTPAATAELGVVTYQASGALSITITPAATPTLIQVLGASGALTITLTPAATPMLVAEATAAGSLTVVVAASALTIYEVSADLGLVILPAAVAWLRQQLTVFGAGGVAFGMRGYAHDVSHDAPSVAVSAPTTEQVFDTGGPSIVPSWAIQQAQGDVQSWYRILITTDDGATSYLDTGWVSGADTSDSIDLDALGVPGDTTNLSVEVRVRSERSQEEGHWEAQSGKIPIQLEWGIPTLAITEPEETENDTSITARWSYADSKGKAQGKYRVRLLSGDDAVLHDSGWLTGTATSYVIPVVTVDNSRYTVGVQVKNAEGVRS